MRQIKGVRPVEHRRTNERRIMAAAAHEEPEPEIKIRGDPDFPSATPAAERCGG